MNWRFAEKISDILVFRTKHKVMSEEIKNVFGDRYFTRAQLRRISWEADSNFKKDLFETWNYPKYTPLFFDRICNVEGLEYLDSSLEKGNGVLVALCHFGCYKMLLPALGFKGYKIHQVAAHPLEFTDSQSSFAKTETMRIEQEYEKSLPAGFIYTGRFNRELFRVLQRGEILVVTVDGIKAEKRISLPLLRRRIRLSPSIGHLSLKTGAPVLPVFTVRDKNNQHRVIIHKELQVQENGEDAVRQMMTEFVSLMERYLKKYPSHYTWFLYKNRTDPPPIGSILESDPIKDT